MKETGFLKTGTGRTVITVIAAIVIWAIFASLWMSGSEASIIVILICTIFGWKALNRIQPVMFLWLPIAGWIIYFTIKFVLSALVGLFVAPFVIGREIGRKI